MCTKCCVNTILVSFQISFRLTELCKAFPVAPNYNNVNIIKHRLEKAIIIPFEI